MKQGATIALGVLALIALAAGGGYWLGTGTGHGGAGAVTAPAASDKGARKDRKLLFYRNPMGLPDTSPVPKKDPMGMDYVAVYEGEDDAESAAVQPIKIAADKVQQMGVRTEAAQMRALDRVVRAAGRVEPDERRLYAIAPKFEGYVERLHVNVTGQPVAQGQALFEVYSPELVSAQREYAIAAGGVESLKEAGGPAQSGMKQLADSTLVRLRNWDVSEEQIKALAKSGVASRTLTFRSPVSGIVTEKKAVQGMRFMPGDTLYQVADLSAVWVLADVFEQDIGQIKTGGRAKVRIDAYPGKVFEGAVTYVYPTLKAETRTVSVRVELANPSQWLKPSMFAQVELPISAKGATPALAVPVSAVIDSGTRQIVLIQRGEGRFEPREVKLGARSDDYIEVIEGVKDGEQVVVAANFLIDAESNLRAAIGGFGHAASATGSGAADGAAHVASSEVKGSSKGASKGPSHQAQGSVDSIDEKGGTIILHHGPVESLNWPAMTMEFKLANVSLLKDLKPGASVAFEFVERQPGEWVITGIKSSAGAKPADPSASSAQPHAGH